MRGHIPFTLLQSFFCTVTYINKEPGVKVMLLMLTVWQENYLEGTFKRELTKYGCLVRECWEGSWRARCLQGWVQRLCCPISISEPWACWVLRKREGEEPSKVRRRRESLKMAVAQEGRAMGPRGSKLGKVSDFERTVPMCPEVSGVIYLHC